MIDKKLTDEEIIKALEYCNADKNECNKCVFQRECESNPFYSAMAKHALDLINRQKAFIESQNKIISQIALAGKNAKAEAYKEFANQIKIHKRRMRGFDLCYEFWDYAVSVEDIDNILKTMVGEEK